jgi:hypothetical protein
VLQSPRTNNLKGLGATLTIYKLYRATRCGPDTEIDPADQLSFYDAGLGSQPPGGAVFVTLCFSSENS